jgi:hypothetical protein
MFGTWRLPIVRSDSENVRCSRGLPLPAGDV